MQDTHTDNGCGANMQNNPYMTGDFLDFSLQVKKPDSLHVNVFSHIYHLYLMSVFGITIYTTSTALHLIWFFTENFKVAYIICS